MNSQADRSWLRRVRHGVVVVSGSLGGHAVARSLTRAVPRILMYHRFSRRPAWRMTDLATFEEHLRYLRQHWRIVSLDAVVDRFKTHGTFDPDEVVITIDDAYADFHELALPVLERLQVPATLYVPTDFVDGKEWLWPDKLLWLVRNSERDVVEFCASGTLSLATLPQRRATWNTLADTLLEMSACDRHAAFVELEQRLGVSTPEQPPRDYQSMTWDQVRDAAQRGVTIGSQATAHVPMARESFERQVELALHSRQRLQAELGQAARHFSYPHGRTQDLDRQSRRAAREAGFESSAAAIAESANREDILFALPRLSSPPDLATLRAKISGLAHLRDWVRG
jgi:peptidoglycan/xylan/chitin deacetylase (PgdA/CDA1 family)